jgi:hippurate hydrolase
MKLNLLACAVGIVALATRAFALDVAAVKPKLIAEINADYPHLEALYKDIHAHPELAFQETRTAAKLATEMRALGFTVTEGVGKTGIVAIYKNGSGPSILVRTELDALPMQEKTGLPYASQAKQQWNGRETFVDHSCGHDIHMTAWVGEAKALLALKDKWSGTLMFIGQPAEEGTRGARAMLDDGLFTHFGKPDYALALHDGSELAGEIYYRYGPGSTNSDGLSITFIGRGGHGAHPENAIDPVVMAARFITDVQTVISREKDPAAFGVVTIGGISSGSAGNIIPDIAQLEGTIRTTDDAVRAKIHDGIRRTANGVAAIAGAPPPQVTIRPGGPAMLNDKAVVDRLVPVLKQAFGVHSHEQSTFIYASEDFSEFLRAGVPGTMVRVGMTSPAMMAAAKAKSELPPENHSPYFAPDPEPTIKAGIEAMTLAVMELMSKAPKS